MDVCCFLLTDMILISKPTTKKGDKVKIIKPPMRLDRILVYSLRDMGTPDLTKKITYQQNTPF